MPDSGRSGESPVPHGYEALNATALSKFLDSIDGVAYATDANGTIVAYGAANWDRFAHTSRAPQLARPDAVLGRRIFDVIAGEEVRTAYRRFMMALAEDRLNAIKFSYRCDVPGVGRAMQMSITRLAGGGSPGFLFQSTLIDQNVRPPMAIFDSRYRLVAATEGERDHIRLCSFCHRLCTVDRDRTHPANWTYEAPPPGEHRVAHAVCPRCHERSAAITANAPGLSPRQREVLAMLVRGYPNKTICAKLGMSPNTVKTHLRVIFRELQATNRTEAATEALRRWPDCASQVEEDAALPR